MKKKPSFIWWIIPLVFGFIGILVTIAVLRKHGSREILKRLALPLILWGIIGIGLLVYYGLFSFV